MESLWLVVTKIWWEDDWKSLFRVTPEFESGLALAFAL